jgi:prepilin-type processing-associated H-X9-DG protein
MELGLALYVSDAGVYPIYGTPVFASVTKRTMWSQLLEPYVGAKWPEVNYDARLVAKTPGRGTFACPGYNKIGGIYGTLSMGRDGAYAYNIGAAGSANIFPTAQSMARVSFLGLSSDNMVLVGTKEPDNPLIHESDIANPSDMIALGDAVLGHSMGMPENAFSGIDRSPALAGLIESEQFAAGGYTFPFLSSDRAMLKRHGGRWNMSFCDGHVEGGKLATFFRWTDDAVVRRWNRDNDPHRTH